MEISYYINDIKTKSQHSVPYHRHVCKMACTSSKAGDARESVFGGYDGAALSASCRFSCGTSNVYHATCWASKGLTGTSARTSWAYRDKASRRPRRSLYLIRSSISEATEGYC